MAFKVAVDAADNVSLNKERRLKEIRHETLFELCHVFQF